MGRHSLPDDDEPADGTQPAVADLPLDDEPRGRHSWRPDVEQSVVVLEPEPARKPSGTHADLALLRADRTLRVRAGVAVLAPFALYVLVLALLGRLDMLVLWVWIPVIVAGVAFGAVLDWGYRKAGRSRGAAAEPQADDVSG
jgi:hypothetical protein